MSDVCKPGGHKSTVSVLCRRKSQATTLVERPTAQRSAMADTGAESNEKYMEGTNYYAPAYGVGH